MQAAKKISSKQINQAVERYVSNVGKKFKTCKHPVKKNAYVSRSKTAAGTPILRVRCLIDHQRKCAKAMRKLRRNQ